MPRNWLTALFGMGCFAALAAGSVTITHAQTPQAPASLANTDALNADAPAAAAAKAPNSAPNIQAAQALLNTARAHEKNREFDKAIADLDQALALHPKYTAAYLDLAYLHNVKRNFDKAVAALDQAILLDGKSAPAYASRGSAYAGKSDYKAAIADFNKSLTLDPKYAYALRNRGSAYVDVKDYDKAIADLDKALEIDPKSAFGHTIRGMAYTGKRDYERGIVEFDKALALDPKSVVAHGSRGNAYFNKMDYDRALADYNRAIELDPSSPYAYAGRGAVHAAKRRPDQAKTDYRQALALDPDNMFAADGLRRLGQPAAKPTPMPKSPAAAMKVMVVRSAAGDCGNQCPEWISAQGDIDGDSAAQFRKVLKAIGSRKLPVFIESGGGSVSEGYEIGRLVRAKGLDVFVTKTEFTCPPNDAGCKDGKAKSGQAFGMPQPHLAKCASSCAFILASGVKRYVGKSSQVGVHQITSFQTHIKVWRTFRPDGTILSERKVSEKTVETKTADRTYTNARNFFTEMGINDSIMKLLRDAPANDMHWLSEPELTATGMATHLINGQQFIEGRTSPGWTDADQKGLVEARRTVHAAALAASSTRNAASPKTAPPSAEAATATAGAAPAKPAPARPKTCDPDENLVDGKCIEKPVSARPLPRQEPQRITAPGADHQCRNLATSCSGAFAYCQRNCGERQAGSRCYGDCETAIGVCRESGTWSTTNCLKRNMTR
jgi:Tfp pilus assembly protein PilF